MKRKFLVSLPLNQEALSYLQEFPKVELDFYTLPKRNAIKMSSVKFKGATFNHYYHVSFDKEERDLSEEQYDDYLEESNFRFVRDRYYIEYKSVLFELDLYLSKLSGLAILEGDAYDDQLPPFLSLREVYSK
jgi:hypothetical protein